MTAPGRGLALVAAAVAAASLVVQYAMLVANTLDTVGPAFATVRYLSYFTVLSNLLVTVVTARAVFAPAANGFTERPWVRGGVALCIAVTGLVYATVLRQLWQPQGWQWWTDAGMHYAVPLLYLAWWLSAVTHGRLHWRDLGRWLLFSLGYVLWTFLRGALVHEYPYPFLDIDQHGWAVVMRNAVAVLALLLAVGAVLIALDRLLGRARK